VQINNINDLYDFDDLPLTKDDLFKDINHNGWVYRAVEKLSKEVKAIKIFHKASIAPD
jgi:hypothetical protein